VSAISDELRAGEVEVRQACFLPVSSVGGGPIIGEVQKIAKGLFVATGHTCWVSRYFMLLNNFVSPVWAGYQQCAWDGESDG
jgi:hypothetical protein